MNKGKQARRRRSSRSRSFIGLTLLFGMASWIGISAVSPIPAFASCSLSHGDGSDPNFVIAVRPDSTVTGVNGNKASWNIGSVSLIAPPSGGIVSTRLDAIYMMTSQSNWIEYGWAYDKQPNGTTVGPYLYDAAYFPGDTSIRQRTDQTIASGANHTMNVHYNTTDDVWHFDLDGVQQTYQRQPLITQGQPQATQEINNSCNNGDSLFWNLHYFQTSAGWSAWPDNAWFCDLETNWGYDYWVPTEFGTSSRTVSYVYPSTWPCPGPY